MFESRWVQRQLEDTGGGGLTVPMPVDGKKSGGEGRGSIGGAEFSQIMPYKKGVVSKDNTDKKVEDIDEIKC